MKTCCRVLATLIALFVPGLLLAAPPQIAAQGVLRNPEGGLMEGKLTLTFRVYASQQAQQALWEEAQAVTVAGGVFSTLLPSDPAKAPFPGDLFLDGKARYLAILPEGQAELPRTPVVSVAYAFQADHAFVADGLSCLGCIGLDHLAATVLQAKNVKFDNTATGLPAATTQDALDLFYSDFDSLVADFAAHVKDSDDHVLDYNAHLAGFDAHVANPDVHHSSLSAGLDIKPASVNIEGTATKLSDGKLDLGPNAKDEVSAAQLTTLTGGPDSDADNLHTHAGAGGGGVCYNAFGTNACASGFEAVLTGKAMFPVGSYSYTGTGDAICVAGGAKNTTLNYTYWGMGDGNGGFSGQISCAICCK